jgi:hypothetical protein
MKPAAFLSALLLAATAASAQMPDQASESHGFAQLALLCPDTKDGKLSKQAQGACKAQTPVSTVVIVPTPACPVSMQAKQGSDGGLVAVRHRAPDAQPAPAPGPSQHIRLVLARFPRENRVVSATVTVRGLSANSRITQTNLYAGEAPSDLRRTLDAVLTAEEDGTVSAELDLPGFTAVNSIRLQALTYADGSSWHVGYRQSCTVMPDLVMRVSIP